MPRSRMLMAVGVLTNLSASWPYLLANFAQPVCGISDTSMTAEPMERTRTRRQVLLAHVDVDDQLIAGEPPALFRMGNQAEGAGVHDRDLRGGVGSAVGGCGCFLGPSSCLRPGPRQRRACLPPRPRARRRPGGSRSSSAGRRLSETGGCGLVRPPARLGADVSVPHSSNRSSQPWLVFCLSSASFAIPGFRPVAGRSLSLRRIRIPCLTSRAVNADQLSTIVHMRPLKVQSGLYLQIRVLGLSGVSARPIHSIALPSMSDLSCWL